jgi:transcriptional regulator with XRE-family HTH domain
MGNSIAPSKGCWIQYQLNLKRITQKTVAQRAGCNNRMVSQFLRGRKNSEKVKNALADVLGYTSFDKLLIAFTDDGGEGDSV